MSVAASTAPPFANSIRTRPLEGKRVLGIARTHSVITDRPREDGGTDIGCTSGELLLMAIGSCAAGSLRNYCEDSGSNSGDFGVEVAFVASATAGARDRIVLAVTVQQALLAHGEEALRAAVLSGGVTSRIALGSEVEVQLRTRESNT